MDSMKSMGKSELVERRDALQKQIMTMKWDLSHNQLHAGKKRKLETLEKELSSVSRVLHE